MSESARLVRNPSSSAYITPHARLVILILQAQGVGLISKDDAEACMSHLLGRADS